MGRAERSGCDDNTAALPYLILLLPGNDQGRTGSMSQVRTSCIGITALLAHPLFQFPALCDQELTEAKQQIICKPRSMKPYLLDKLIFLRLFQELTPAHFG
jgi:hypothetical protein